MESGWNDTDWKTKAFVGKTYANFLFIQEWPRIDPHFCLERLTTNHLNFGAAVIPSCFPFI
jgi:hypothetical protein